MGACGSPVQPVQLSEKGMDLLYLQVLTSQFKKALQEVIVAEENRLKVLQGEEDGLKREYEEQV